MAWVAFRYLKSDFSTLGQEILREPIPIEAGELIVPKTQGLGIEVNEAVIDWALSLETGFGF